MKNRIPNWLRIIIMLLFISLWFLAGGITLIAYSEITKKYINPDVSSFYIILAFVLVVALISRTRSESVLYSMEILLILNAPIIAWVFYKAATNPSMNYDACMEIVTRKKTYSLSLDDSYYWSGCIAD
ncbi:hypothetical protein [Paenibacillus sp. N3.4]|uniref:hypothetical protein n=1 Tax=Paenibacillus sp. N3.4 TaxID=2603222 RepID=UPI0011C8C03E|nr:hypothetical protein [Paenibacillus sp. N3.4]TXK85799.1 hypothetical protein FU659_02545 [Paenibacillus sp. N3.4]